MEVTILPAGMEEVNALAEVHAPAWQRAYLGIVPHGVLDAFTVESRVEPFRQAIGRGEESYYLVRVAGRPAGLLSLHRSHEASEPPTVGEIYALYLHPDFWGSGLGGRVMEFALAELTRRGFLQVNLWVLAENARARAFYEKWGFLPDGRETTLTLGRELKEVRYTRGL